MNNFQRLFLDALQERYETRNTLVEELSELLKLGKDGIYRRLRGDTMLSMEELFFLSKHYEISLDELNYGGEPKINFTYPLNNNGLNPPKKFLERLLDQLKNLRTYQNPKIWCAANDIPIYYYALVPEIFFFKFFAWNYSMETPPYAQPKFLPLEISSDFLKLCQEIISEYSFLPSEELWTTTIFDATLQQIYFHAVNQHFQDAEEAIILCEKMYLLVEHFRRMAAKSAKIRHLGGIPYETPFHLFYNETLSPNHHYLMESDNGKIMLNSYCYPNFLLTKEGRICEYTLQWFQKIRGKSTYLSGNSEEMRTSYFEGINEKIKGTLEKIREIPSD